MFKKSRLDQNGIAHLMLIVSVIAVVGGIALVGFTVAKNRSSDTASSATNTAQTAPKPIKKINSSHPNTASTTNNSSSPAPSSGSTSSNNSGGGASSSQAPVPAPAAAPVASSYTNLGTISAANLYNVKVPPSGSQQPTMTIYACVRNLGNNTSNVQAYGLLSYGIPQAASSAWYVGLDLSSSASANNTISSKAGTYSYQINSWLNSGANTSQSNVITSANFNPGTISDFYVWASGSYGGTTWNNASSHPNATQLAVCK